MAALLTVKSPPVGFGVLLSVDAPAAGPRVTLTAPGPRTGPAVGAAVDDAAFELVDFNAVPGAVEISRNRASAAGGNT